jgi:hypothetical protein
VPTVTDGEVTVIEVADVDFTVAGTMTLPAAGVPPDSSMKFTVVAPAPLLEKPVPLIVTDVPPVVGPVLTLRLVMVGTTGDHTQLFIVMPVPQYTTHCAVVGALITPVG